MMQSDTVNYDTLQTMILEAVQAYEQARAIRLETEYRLQQEEAAAKQQLHTEEAQRRAEAEDEYRVVLSSGAGKRAQLGQLAQLTSGLLKDAEELLHNAGLAYVVSGNSAQPGGDLQRSTHDDGPASDESIASTFAAAVTAHAEVRAGLLRLGQQLVMEKRWAEARQIIDPLLTEEDAPLHVAAVRLLCASFYDEARWAMSDRAWPAARFALDPLLEIDSHYRDAAQLRKETFLPWRILYWFHPVRHKVLRSRWGTNLGR